MTIPRILAIAGSDSGGGAGIQADIKTITMLGGHAMTAITAVTAQNTRGVMAVETVSPDMVLAQIAAVASDIGVDAIKIGMIGSAATAAALADRLEKFAGVPIVFDPVMVATSGARLADEATIRAFGRLMDIATIVTPNMPELAALASREQGADDPVAAALGLVSAHRCAVMIKGGHDESGSDARGDDPLVDALIEEDNMTSWQGSRIATRHTHGTGCTLSSAIAYWLATGCTLSVAVDRARVFVRHALLGAPGLGKGAGPVGQGSVRVDGTGGPQINQITVCMDDYAASAAFYTALGLRQIVENPPDYARFEAANGMTLSIHHDDQFRMPGGTQIYLECDDLDAAAARLAAAGLPFEHPPVEQPWMWREARLRDPFGNIVCLYKAGEARRFPPWRIADAAADPPPRRGAAA